MSDMKWQRDSEIRRGGIWSQDSWLTGTKPIWSTFGRLSINYPAVVSSSGFLFLQKSPFLCNPTFLSTFLLSSFDFSHCCYLFAGHLSACFCFLHFYQNNLMWKYCLPKVWTCCWRDENQCWSNFLRKKLIKPTFRPLALQEWPNFRPGNDMFFTPQQKFKKCSETE